MNNFPIDLSPEVFRKEYKDYLNDYQVKLLDFFGQSNSLEMISIILFPSEEDAGFRVQNVKCAFKLRGKGIEGGFTFYFKK